MSSVRKRKATLSRLVQYRARTLEDRLWDQMPPVGREWGSPDFERLMEEDGLKGGGVFDPALKARHPSTIDIPEDLPVQRRRKL